MTTTTITRRDLLLGGAAAGLLAGCAAPYPTDDAESAYPPIGRFIESEGLRIHAWQAGPADAQPVVLVHGASGNLRDWTFSIAPRLAARYRVIAVDRPGFGYSDRPAKRGWDPAVQARILRGATTKLGAERPVVVGHSWAGALALAWGLDAPDDVAGIVPVSGVTMPYSGIARVFHAIGISGALTWAYTEYMKSTMDDGGIEQFIDRVFRPQTPPDGYISYVGGPLALRRKTLEANAADIENLNAAVRAMAPRYSGLGRPVEIIHGAEDFIDPGRHALGLRDAIPGASLTLLPGVGHMAHHAAPEALIAALDRIAASAPA